MKNQKSQQEAFILILEKEQKHRRKRGDIVTFQGVSHCLWYKLEMEALLSAINDCREEKGWKLFSMEGLLRMELQASGHYDYTRKLALYASEIAQAENPEEWAFLGAL